MSKWKCIIAVPMEFEIEYANNIGTARAGAEKIRDSHKPVLDPEANGGAYQAKIISIIGPKEDVDDWAKQRREERTVADAPSGPSLGDEPDGPSAA